MNMPPVCGAKLVMDGGGNPVVAECGHPALWMVFDKTICEHYETCEEHVGLTLTPGHTHVIYETKDYSKKAQGDHWCADCGKKIEGRPIFYMGASTKCVPCHLNRVRDDTGSDHKGGDDERG